MSNDLNERVTRLEQAVFGPKATFGPKDVVPPRPSDWKWCARDGCTRGSFQATPACMTCAGYDPRDPRCDQPPSPTSISKG